MSAFASLTAALHNPDFVDVSDYPQVRVDLRYGSTNNLLRQDIYGGFQRALLHREAAGKFRTACEALQSRHPDLTFIIFDALRPQSAQVRFWELVAGTPQQNYFAPPEKGSVHSYGFAIDIGLLGGDGKELDMGTGFDDLTPLAEPRQEQEQLAAGKLLPGQRANRMILRSLMEAAGFFQLPHEWWHYDALPPAEVRAKYQRLE